MHDRRLKVCKLAGLVNILKDYIYHNILGMKKLTSRCLTLLLKVCQKRIWVNKECFDLFKRNPDEYLWCFLTGDQACNYQYTSEMMQQFSQLTLCAPWAGESDPKKAKIVPLTRKATTVWDARSYKLSKTKHNHHRGELCLHTGPI